MKKRVWVTVQVARRQNRSGGSGRKGRFKWVLVYERRLMEITNAEE